MAGIRKMFSRFSLENFYLCPRAKFWAPNFLNNLSWKLNILSNVIFQDFHFQTKIKVSKILQN